MMTCVLPSGQGDPAGGDELARYSLPSDHGLSAEDHEACHFSVQQAFAVTHSHYENINLEAMGQGFVPGYEDDELERIEEIVTTPA
jgi:dipeptidase